MGNGVCSVKHFLEVLFVCEVSFCFASVASQAESLLRFTLGTLGQRLFRLFHLGLDHKSQVITTWWSHHPCLSRSVPELRFRSVMLVFVKPDRRSSEKKRKTRNLTSSNAQGEIAEIMWNWVDEPGVSECERPPNIWLSLSSHPNFRDLSRSRLGT